MFGDGGEELLLSGIADAIAFDDLGVRDVVADGKSDAAPDMAALGHYRQRISDYRAQTKANSALLVFVTSGQVFDVV
jgi:hypothetical protein